MTLSGPNYLHVAKEEVAKKAIESDQGRRFRILGAERGGALHKRRRCTRGVKLFLRDLFFRFLDFTDRISDSLPWRQ